jgi:hypothetical protein
MYSKPRLDGVGTDWTGQGPSFGRLHPLNMVPAVNHKREDWSMTAAMIPSEQAVSLYWGL